MKTFTVNYKIGSFGCINFDVELDIDEDHPDFQKIIQEKADSIIESEISNYGTVEYIY